MPFDLKGSIATGFSLWMLKDKFLFDFSRNVEVFFLEDLFVVYLYALLLGLYKFYSCIDYSFGGGIWE
ncbi:MAG TPA: hypothetical protein VK175_10990 [Leadbetterella sp.]|nr:hypothetical protein [Leadbetterella sp.]